MGDTVMKRKETVIKEIVVDNMPVILQRKPIKNYYLKVKPPHGVIWVSAPFEANIEQVRKFVNKHMNWIHKQKEAIRNMQESAEGSQGVNLQSGNKLPFWGKEYVLNLSAAQGRERIEIEGDQLIMEVKTSRSEADHLQMLYNWYWNALGSAISALSSRYMRRMDIYPHQWKIRDMTTRWGSCSVEAKRIWLSLALVAKAPQCLEYVIVHEMCHLLEPGHNEVFWGYVEQYYPNYKEAKDLLKAAPHFPRFRSS
jgi:predicted metal-dependent hydrolase